jgi:hypothetical protein
MKRTGQDVSHLGEDAKRFGEEVAGHADVGRDPQVFAHNLKRLTLMHGLSLRQAAEKVGADYQWYRRAATRGLSRVGKKTRPVLERVVQVFGLTTVDDLWESGLIRFQRGGGLDRDADPHTHYVWRQKEWWPWAKKLAHILASGKHDYLQDLIDALYETVREEGFKEPEQGASYWSSGD